MARKKAKTTAGTAASYDSSHGATRKITAAAKLAELACERIAEYENRSLPPRFWMLTEPLTGEPSSSWSGRFYDQMIFANSLLKLFEAEVVIRAFRAMPRVRSLGASFFLAELKLQERKLEEDRRRALETPEIIISTSTTSAPRAGVPTARSARAKLSRLDAPKAPTQGGQAKG